MRTMLMVVLMAAACGGEDETTKAEAIELAGEWFYPESITASADGTLYVSSVATGEVARIRPGGTAETFIAAGDPSNTTGLLVDDARATLWLCAVNFAGQPTELRAYDLGDGSLERTVAVPGFCTDLALSGSAVLVTDSALGAIHRVDGDVLETWFEDELLAPAPGGFGANGIVVEQGGDLVVTNMSKGTLVRVAADGSGAAELASGFTSPDGLRLRADGSFLVVEAGGGTSGRLTHVDGATRTTLASGLRFPTSVVEVDGDLWVSEGQLDELLKTLASPPGTPAPVLPFYVKRVDAE